MNEPRPAEAATGCEPEQTTEHDPIGEITPPKASRFGARALALAGFAAFASSAIANTNLPTPTTHPL